MKKMLVLLVAIFIVRIPYTVHAATLDGKWALKNCSVFMKVSDGKINSFTLGPDQIADAFYCAGVIQGIKDSLWKYQIYLSESKTKPYVCLPANNIQNGQAVKILINYLHAHPQTLRNSITLVTITALQDTFPCK
jgi:hypothetical protein